MTRAKSTETRAGAASRRSAEVRQTASVTRECTATAPGRSPTVHVRENERQRDEGNERGGAKPNRRTTLEADPLQLAIAHARLAARSHQRHVRRMNSPRGPRRRRRTTLAASSADSISSTLTALIGLAVACTAVHATPTHLAALPSRLAALPAPTGATRPGPVAVGGLHVPLLRRNGHLRALARTPNPVDQSEIVAGWALREKGRVAVKYGVGAATANDGGVAIVKRADEASERRDSDQEQYSELVDETDGPQLGRRPRRKSRRRRTPLSDRDSAARAPGDDDDEARDEAQEQEEVEGMLSLVRRQLGGPNGGQLGTATSTSTTRTALSTAGYGTATRSGNNSATRTAPTSLPGPTSTMPVGDVQLTNYDADL